MHYFFLALAIIFEAIGSSFLQASKGFTKIIPVFVTSVSYLLCFFFLAQALKNIPLGIAYAVWAGAGIVLTAVIGVVIFKQTIDTPALLGMFLIVAGVVVMNLFSNTASH